jgi:hypothetical protein
VSDGEIKPKAPNTGGAILSSVSRDLKLSEVAQNTISSVPLSATGLQQGYHKALAQAIYKNNVQVAVSGVLKYFLKKKDTHN